MARSVAVCLLLAALGLAACDGSGSAEPSTTSSAPSASTTTVVTTTTVAATSTTASAAQALAAEKANVEAAYRAVEAAHLNALTVLGDYDPATIRAVYAPGPLLDGELQDIADFRGQGRRLKLNDPDVHVYTVESDSLASADATTASIIACNSNNGVVYEPGASPGPEDDVIVDDSQGASRVQWDMVKEGGAWVAQHHAILRRWPGESVCPSA
jgi:hypothetical protein